MDVLISDEKGFLDRRETRALRRASLRALRALGVEDRSELSLAFTGDDEMRKLNFQYRNRDRTTDVLSFPQVGVRGEADTRGVLGDVVISVEAARRNARRYGVGLREELLRLIVHGTLHLLGYDHKRASDRARMRAKEEEVLGEIVER